MTLQDAMQIAVQNNLSIVLKKEQLAAVREQNPDGTGSLRARRRRRRPALRHQLATNDGPGRPGRPALQPEERRL